jgi:O-antigen ligase
MLIVMVAAYGGVDIWALGIQSFFAGIIAVLWLIQSWRERAFVFNASSLLIPLSALILIGIIQLLPFRSVDVSGLLTVSAVSSLSLDPYLTRMAVIQLVIYFVFFAAALRFVNSEARVRKIVTLIVVFGGINAFFAILQRLANTDGIYGIRPTVQAVSFGSFINEHHFAAFMEMCLGITLGVLFGKATKQDKRVLLIIAASLMGIGLLFTGSRGGYLSLFAVVAFAGLMNLPAKRSDGEEGSLIRRHGALAGGILTAVAVVIGSILFLGANDSLMRGVGIADFSGDFSMGRTHFWYVALQIFRDYPIFGAGLDAFGTAFPRYDSWNGIWRVEQAHNDYLQILADAGILGFACVASFIYLLFRSGVREIRRTSDKFRRSVAAGALAGCLGILIHSFFDFPLRTPSNALFFLMLAALATVRIGTSISRRK